ncbi:MAG: ATP-binding protein [Eubacteriales bacterium]|nr:ATP-binding protein [Eubacteriales bacterium]
MNEISLHVLDIIQNSIKAGADLIVIVIEFDGERLTVTITDNGCGMDAETAARVTDPFVTSRTTRRVGLGIPLFKASAEATGGSLTVRSEKGVGTVVQAIFYYGHIDCPPLGSMTQTIVSQIVCHTDVDFAYSFVTPRGRMDFSTREVRQVLGDDVPLDTPEVVVWMRESIDNEINEIGGGSIQ